MKYNFDSTAYRRENGIVPRGKGHWAFIVRGASLPDIAPETSIERDCIGVPDTLFWIPGVWSLTEAKKRASIMLAANAVPEWAEIEIAP